MLEAADNPMPGIDIESSVNPEGHHVEQLEKLADEAYRAIRTNLQFLPKHERSEVIAITSSVSGEGKTTTASNLAKIIAQTGKKVAVLDLDLRKEAWGQEHFIVSAPEGILVDVIKMIPPTDEFKDSYI